MRSKTRRDRRRAAGIGTLVALAVAAAGAFGAAPLQAQVTLHAAAPEVRFHLGGEELLPIAYPDRYRSAERLREDVAWVEGDSEDLRERWAEEGSVYLRRVTDLAGLRWPYAAVDVWLVRYWPIVSIEHPLVLALDAIRSSDGEVDLPEDTDLRMLLLAHQVVHHLLDDPGFVPPALRDPVYDHPLLEPGDFTLEAMVNWLTYEALGDVWGAQRLRRATATDLWRGYNPNHAFVIDELIEGWDLSRTRSLRDWLVDHPEESEIVEIADRYRREAGLPERRDEVADPRENRTGTDYGVDLGATFDGEVFVAWVDEGSPAARAGLTRGDVLLTVEGRAVEDVIGAQRRMDEAWRMDGEIDLSVRRGEREVFVTVEE